MKVAVVGARGIGKHHAKWLAHSGCEVTAIYGTGDDSAAAAAAVLREQIGFTGAVFSDWRRFLNEGSFDACSVCSPAEAHAANLLDLAAAGKHVLFEKPLVWDWERSADALDADARAAIDAIERAGVIAAMNAQYPAALEGFAALHQQVRKEPPHFRALEFLLETKGKPRSPHGAAEAWVDLAPHPLALIDTVAPGAVMWETLAVVQGAQEFSARFDWQPIDLTIPPIRVHLEGRRISEGTPRRRLGNQDLTVDYDGTHLNGEFVARLQAEGETWTGPDLMRVSIERFVDAVRTGNPSRVLVTPAAALRQHQALLGVWRRVWGGGCAAIAKP